MGNEVSRIVMPFPASGGIDAGDIVDARVISATGHALPSIDRKSVTHASGLNCYL
jgi:hypothetical protein